MIVFPLRCVYVARGRRGACWEYHPSDFPSRLRASRTAEVKSIARGAPMIRTTVQFVTCFFFFFQAQKILKEKKWAWFRAFPATPPQWPPGRVQDHPPQPQTHHGPSTCSNVAWLSVSTRSSGLSNPPPLLRSNPPADQDPAWANCPPGCHGVIIIIQRALSHRRHRFGIRRNSNRRYLHQPRRL